jgi:uncharacterized phage protein gp47/JayE
VAVYGREIENDNDLRYRFNQTAQGAGSATAAAVKSAVLRVELVEGVEVVENETDETVNGIPPHRFETFVLAPESQDQLVAAAIFSKKPLGIKPHGDISVDFVDENGVDHTVAFSRTIKKPVYIRLSISVNNFFEEDGVDTIKSNIAQLINTLKNGDDVYISSMYGSIHKVAGVVNVPSLTMSADGVTYNTGNITVESNEVARVDIANIEVVVNE